MDKIILGYLMLCGMSAYDLKTSIRRDMSSMCSASAGSIYAALKKLLGQGMIGEEASDDGLHDKKIYYITELGREAFLQWIGEPMSFEKAKNMELAKIFFGGMQSKEEQIVALKGYVNSLVLELEVLMQIKKANKPMDAGEIIQMQERLMADAYNGEGMKALENGRVSTEMVGQINQNQMRTLEYGIALIRFQIEWYEKMITEIGNEREAK